jgi:hypothetical protein
MQPIIGLFGKTSFKTGNKNQLYKKMLMKIIEKREEQRK